MEHCNGYHLLMSQLYPLKDLKENEKTKISLVHNQRNDSICILRICKGRDLAAVCNALKGIQHRNIVSVYDFVFDNGDTYILEEYVAGNTLEEELDIKGTLSEDRAAEIIIDVCKALEEMHSKEPPVVHNDINPSNIKLYDRTAKLFDFDISRTFKKGKTQNTVLFGTEEYASPEHFGFGQSEPRTDIYCLGVTMHKMLTGCGLSSEHQVTYSGPLKSIISKCTGRDPENRYSSAVALRKDLEKFLARKKNILRTMLGVLLAGIIVCGLMFVMGQFDAKNEKPTDGTVTGQPTNVVGAPTTETQLDNIVASTGKETTNNNETSIPAETHPTLECTKSFIETLVSLPQNANELVFTKNGTVFYIKDNKLFTIKNGITTQLFDGEADYYEEITEPDMVAAIKEDPNYWSGLDDEEFIHIDRILYFDRLVLSGLGYHYDSDTVYILGSTNVERAAGLDVWKQLVFAVPNVETPIMNFHCAAFEASVTAQGVVETVINYTNQTIVWGRKNSKRRLEIDPISGTTVTYVQSFYDTRPVFIDNRQYLYAAGVLYELSSWGDFNRFDLSSSEWVCLSLADGNLSNATAYCVYESKLYYATNDGIWCLEASGTNRFQSVNVLYWSDLEIRDRAPVGVVSQFLFDDNGDLLFCDDTQHRLRKITMSQ